MNQAVWRKIAGETGPCQWFMVMMVNTVIVNLTGLISKNIAEGHLHNYLQTISKKDSLHSCASSSMCAVPRQALGQGGMGQGEKEKPVFIPLLPAATR